MADSVNRIVPPSVFPDRTAQSGRERESKRRDEKAKKQPGEETPQVVEEQKTNGVDEASAPEKNTTKGKNLDIRA
jgi:hypothetical protein